MQQVRISFIVLSICCALCVDRGSAAFLRTPQQSRMHSPNKESEIELRQEMQNLTRRVGSRAKFLCDITGQPIPKFRWYKNNVYLPMGEKDNMKIVTELWGSQLRIEKVQLDNAGQYTCTASNLRGQINTTAYLQVLSEPKTLKKPEGNVDDEVDLFPSAKGSHDRVTCEKFKSNVCKQFRSDKFVSVSTSKSQMALEQEFGRWLASWGHFKDWKPFNPSCIESLMRRLCLYHWPECLPLEEENAMQTDYVEDALGGRGFMILPLCREECILSVNESCIPEETRMALYLHANFPQIAYNCSLLPTFQATLTMSSQMPPPGNCLLSNETWKIMQKASAISSSLSDLESSPSMIPDGTNRVHWPISRAVWVITVTVGGLLSLLGIMLSIWCVYNHTGHRSLGWWCPKKDGTSRHASNGMNMKIKSKWKQPLTTSAGGGAAAAGDSAVGPILNNGMYYSHSQDTMNDTLAVREFPLSQIRLGEKLGHGSFGPLFRGELVGLHAQDTRLTPVMVKALFIPNPSQQAMSRNQGEECQEEVERLFRTELSLHSGLKHENVLSIVGVSLRQNPRCIVYEWPIYGDLHEYLLIESGRSRANPLLTPESSNNQGKTYTEGVLLSYPSQLHIVCQVARALEYLHTRHHVLHRDVAARNVHVGEGLLCKLGDMASSRDKYAVEYVDWHATQTNRVPLRWMAAEVLLSGAYSQASDVWSFGILLWEVWSGGLRPYGNSASDVEIVEAIRQRHLLSPPEHCPANVYAMMLECWSELPQHRPLMSEVSTRLHRWKEEVIHSVVSRRRPLPPQNLASGGSMPVPAEEEEVTYTTPLPAPGLLVSYKPIPGNLVRGVPGVDSVPLLLGLNSPSGQSGGSNHTHTTHTSSNSPGAPVCLPPPPRTFSLPLPPPYDVLPLTPLMNCTRRESDMAPVSNVKEQADSCSTTSTSSDSSESHHYHNLHDHRIRQLV